jgi:hypothetical protein
VQADDLVARKKAGRPVSWAVPGSDPGSGDMSALLLRAWLEPGVPPRLRARLLELRPGSDPEQLAVTASVEEACQAVRRWLESLRGPTSMPPGGNRGQW